MVKFGQSIRDRLKWRSLGFLFVLAVFYSVAAAAAYQGFYTKWGMHDGVQERSLVTMMDGTAGRPYVYRQLLPQTAIAIENAIPPAWVEKIEHKLQNSVGNLRSPQGVDANKTGYVLKYRIVYYLSYLSCFAMMFAARGLMLQVGFSAQASAIAPVVIALMFPIIQTRGGYFYDFPEMLAFFLAASLALRGAWLPLALLAIPATMNKEAFFFFVPTLFPLLIRRMSWRKAVVVIGGVMFVSGVTYQGVRMAYADNPGGAVLFHYFKPVLWYLNPINLLKVENTYGILLLKGYGVFMFAWFAMVLRYGWGLVPRWTHLHLAIAAVINLPLFILFCAEGELRNLSLMFVAFALMLAAGIQRWLGYEPLPSAKASP